MKTVLLLCLISFAVWADDEVEQKESKQTKNCKLTIKTTLNDRSVKVDVQESTVADKMACQKLMTKAQQFTDENIKQVNVEMSFSK